ncbi:DNA photolyase [Thermodesulfobacterium sp. TA1]|uniref:SPL family radical SAM protein n=1 Tax=Thermodesulfobacterium sp. TA1 TaxID=2234087 RepID=UPI001232B524|nr:radical SAM protein [Thermodesulfobacterium sp. TA1]QER42143.1 DNA photolyase [Thermodesulfobacterium sp. TA1]
MKILIEKEAFPYLLTQEIIAKYPYEIISSYEEFHWEAGAFPASVISLGKKYLFLMRFRGRFFRNCPGTKNYLCCGYKIFHFAEGCLFDCTYCILQVYLNRPGIKLWANLIEEGFPELETVLDNAKREGRVLRIGTGEFADSMVLEPFGGVSEKLINFWEEKDPWAVLELKTKAFIKETYFKKFKPNPKIIFAWSVNTPFIIQSEEIGTPSLDQRLESAKLAVAHGFTVAFHFDPIIFYENAEIEYPKVLERILNEIPWEKIAWISLGTLRYPKELKYIAEERFPKTKIYSYEFIEGLDMKKRYFIDLRKRLYQNLAKLIKETEDKIAFYFCMESERVWKEVLGKPFENPEQVVQLLDKVAYRLCQG